MRYHSRDSELDEYYAEIDQLHLQPLWEMKNLLTHSPSVMAIPWVWRAADLRHMAERSGQLVPIDRGGDRRVLALSNPGLRGAPFVSSTLWAAVQFLQPGELAPAHRHTPAALRVVIDGGGAYTLVDGDPVVMSRGDLVLTPSWTFHEHHNPGQRSTMWLDVLDLPVVSALDAVFFEEGPSETVDQSEALLSDSERRFGQGPGLIPTGASSQRFDRAYSPLTVYRWADTDDALDALLQAGGPGYAELRFRDPTRDRDVMPTLRCEMRRMQPGVVTPADRQTGTRLCAVLNGSGTVRLDHREISLNSGDIFVVPSWCEHEVLASTTLDIFTTSDAPVLEALDLFRREETGS